ncbi:MAG: T9SS type A sorting domain-containing protein [Bacteroidota bacterium]
MLTGHYTFSTVRIVPAVSGNERIIVYPFLRTIVFHLAINNIGSVKRVQLISINGTVLRTWGQYQGQYDIQDIPAGNYIISVQTDNTIQMLKLVK